MYCSLVLVCLASSDACFGVLFDLSVLKEEVCCLISYYQYQYCVDVYHILPGLFNCLVLHYGQAAAKVSVISIIQIATCMNEGL
jgi:hypothetical protein